MEDQLMGTLDSAYSFMLQTPTLRPQLNLFLNDYAHHWDIHQSQYIYQHTHAQKFFR